MNADSSNSGEGPEEEGSKREINRGMTEVKSLIGVRSVDTILAMV